METATILVVCTGNVRRSPAIEAMLRQGISSLPGLDGFDVSVASAGTRALVGDSMDPHVQRQLEALGVTATDHVARQVTADLIESADLVITAERDQRSTVVGLVPAAVRRTFTLKELAALGERVGRNRLGGTGVDAATRLRELVRQAPLERAARVIGRGSDDDLQDLTRRSDRAARRLVADLTASVTVLLQLLEPEPALTIIARPESARRKPRRAERRSAG